MARSKEVLARAVRSATRWQRLAFIGLAVGSVLSAILALFGESHLALAIVSILLGILVGQSILQQHLLSSRIERAKVATVAAAGAPRHEVKATRAKAEKTVKVDHLTGDPWRLTASQWWARRLRDAPPSRLARFVLFAKRSRGTVALDVLAYIASSGAYNYREFAERVTSLKGNSRKLVSGDSVAWSVPGLTAFARALVAQASIVPNARHVAYGAYELAVSIGSHRALKGTDRSFYGDLLLDAGRRQESIEVLGRPVSDPARASNHRLLSANALNPAIVGPDFSLDAWLELVNRDYVASGIAPIAMADGNVPSFYSLSAQCNSSRSGGPLVSVVMPVYEASEETDVAISSVLSQTWSNLELIIVDDGSPRQDVHGESTDYIERLEKWANADSRVRLILNEENRGAYWARNTGYVAASGKYITIADKDDWHHPQQIEMQVAYLEREGAPVAVLANWVRVDPSLRFVMRWGPDLVVHKSFASTMFSRAAILERLGFWDTVRKGADSEFLRRLEIAFEFQIEPVSAVPLAFSFLGSGNLTSDDVGLGYESDSRRTYRQSYSGWHAHIRNGGNAYMPLDPDERAFPAPAEFLPTREGITECDVVYLADFAGQSSRLRAETISEIESLVELGLHVAIVPTADPMRSSEDVVVHELEALVLSGKVARLAMSEDVRARLAVVRTPRAMHVDQYPRSGVRAVAAVIVADQPPFNFGTGERYYDPTLVAGNVRDAVGATPRWAPVDEGTKRKISALVDPEALVATWTGAAEYVASTRLG